MKFTSTILQGVYIVDVKPFSDDRGWFVRTFCKEDFQEIAPNLEWVQINHSWNEKVGTIRGMHYQRNPFAEAKLVRCIVGKVFDVIIDLRGDSPTFLQWTSVELSDKNRRMIYIPEGFAHGYQTLTNNAQLIYHHTSPYTPLAECGLRYNDPNIGIKWPLQTSVISRKDQHYPLIDPEIRYSKEINLHNPVWQK